MRGLYYHLHISVNYAYCFGTPTVQLLYFWTLCILMFLHVFKTKMFQGMSSTSEKQH
jgi:hypothetical protein